jgi:transcription elongation GreA/GreB family factor
VQKSALRSAILDKLRQDLALQSSAAQMAHDEAISEESRAENKWDTHSQEAAYLAEGQAKIAGEISANIEVYTAIPLPDFAPTDIVAIGAVVELEPVGGGNKAWFFVGPRAGGMDLKAEGREILVVTPQSPLGRQLLGKRVGDEVAATGRGAAARLRIAAVE